MFFLLVKIPICDHCSIQKQRYETFVRMEKRVGEEEAKKIMVQASRRGTAVHRIAEKYVLNEDNYAQGAMPSGLDSFKSLKQYLDKHVDNIYGVELPLHSIGPQNSRKM
jgi:hypothetical protein